MTPKQYELKKPGKNTELDEMINIVTMSTIESRKVALDIDDASVHLIISKFGITSTATRWFAFQPNRCVTIALYSLYS